MHTRSPSKLAESRRLVVEGDVCRESNVAGRLVNKRWMQLYGAGGAGGGAAQPEPPLLASYRHRGDGEPSKLWEVTRSCSVSEVERGTFHLRPEVSTLVAVVAGRYQDVEMVSTAGQGVGWWCGWVWDGLKLQRLATAAARMGITLPAPAPALATTLPPRVRHFAGPPWARLCLPPTSPLPRPWPAPQYSFSLHFGFSGLFAAESLRLCFEEEAAAREWHRQLTAAIGHMERLGSSGVWG